MNAPDRRTRGPIRLYVMAIVLATVSSTVGDGVETAAPPRLSVAARADSLDGMLTPGIDEVLGALAVPGAVVHVQTPKGVWQRAFGTRTVDVEDPVTIGDFFRVGSTTKTMVGTVVWQLVAEGRLGLDDPVSKYRSDVPNGSAITIAQLLDMRSGLFSYNELPAFAATMDADPAHIWRPEELLRLGLSRSPYFPPDTDFRYSNTNTILLALIVQQLTGTEIGTLLTERVFRPLGLRNTSFPAPGEVALPFPSPHGYLYGSNASALISPRLPDSEVAAVRAGTLRPTDVTHLDPSWIWAAGAVISTASDLATYVRALVSDNGLLASGPRGQRLDSATPVNRADPAATHYGLGLESFGPMLGHDGAIPGFQTFMGYDPVSDISIIVLCTVRDGPAGGRPANEIAYGIVRTLIGG